jgi:hypothetical protein
MMGSLIFDLLRRNLVPTLPPHRFSFFSKKGSCSKWDMIAEEYMRGRAGTAKAGSRFVPVLSL